MPTTKEYTVYQFDELNDHAKKRARDWFRQGIEPDDYADSVIEDAANVGALLGISMQTKRVPLMNGSTRMDPDVYWSLNRDRGLSFAGSYAYAKGAAKKVRAEYPQDSALHEIADTLQCVQRAYFYRLTARIDHGRPGSYPHCAIDVDYDAPMNDARDITADASDVISTALTDFADWILDRIEAEYDYRHSDDAVDEDIRANEYTFTADGQRED